MKVRGVWEEKEDVEEINLRLQNDRRGMTEGEGEGKVERKIGRAEQERRRKGRGKRGSEAYL